MTDSALTVPVQMLTKKGLSAFANQLAEDAIDGFTNPLRQFIQLSAIKKVADETLQAIKPYALEEADKYESWDMSWAGVQFQIRQGALQLDYSGDDEWSRLNAKKDELEAELKKIKAQLKKRERFLKESYLDLDTGELTESISLLKVGEPTLALFFQDGE